MLAVVMASLESIEPLFMKFIMDDVLLNTRISNAERMTQLNLIGAAFLLVVILSSVFSMLRDYRQRLLNTHLMLSLRRALFDRLLHLPLPNLWEMKTGGILSRFTGDVE